MSKRFIVSLSFAALVILAPTCLAQTDQKKVSKPPAAELEKFKPFLGDYIGNYSESKWTYNTGFKSAVSGWYVEFFFLTKTEGIDRELRMLMTYDTKQKKYRIWRFETLAPLPQLEGELRFEGDEIVMEWKMAEFRGKTGTFRNRCKMTSKDDLEIITEFQQQDGKLDNLGTLKAKRKA